MIENVAFTKKTKRFWLTLVGSVVFVTPTLIHAAEDQDLKGAVDYYVFWFNVQWRACRTKTAVRQLVLHGLH